MPVFVCVSDLLDRQLVFVELLFVFTSYSFLCLFVPVLCVLVEFFFNYDSFCLSSSSVSSDS